MSIKEFPESEMLRIYGTLPLRHSAAPHVVAEGMWNYPTFRAIDGEIRIMVEFELTAHLVNAIELNEPVTINGPSRWLRIIVSMPGEGCRVQHVYHNGYPINAPKYSYGLEQS